MVLYRGDFVKITFVRPKKVSKQTVIRIDISEDDYFNKYKFLFVVFPKTVVNRCSGRPLKIWRVGRRREPQNFKSRLIGRSMWVSLES